MLIVYDSVSDTDNDGMPDEWEVAHGLNPLVNDASLDNDNDGITNINQYNIDNNINQLPISDANLTAILNNATRLYTYKCDHIEQLKFASGDLIVSVYDTNPTNLPNTQTGTYYVDGNTLYTTLNAQEQKHILVEYPSDYIKFNESDGSSSYLYFTSQSAIENPDNSSCSAENLTEIFGLELRLENQIIKMEKINDSLLQLTGDTLAGPDVDAHDFVISNTTSRHWKINMKFSPDEQQGEYPNALSIRNSNTRVINGVEQLVEASLAIYGGNGVGGYVDFRDGNPRVEYTSNLVDFNISVYHDYEINWTTDNKIKYLIDGNEVFSVDIPVYDSIVSQNNLITLQGSGIGYIAGIKYSVPSAELVFDNIGSHVLALQNPNGNEIWQYDKNETISWDIIKIIGSVVDLYVLHDDPSDLNNYRSSVPFMLESKNWYQFANDINNTGSYTVNPRDLNGNGNAYVVLIVSNTGSNWDISDRTFTLTDLPINCNDANPLTIDSYNTSISQCEHLPDGDGDGHGDNSDAFPSDPNEWTDSNGNGIGDNFDAESNVISTPTLKESNGVYSIEYNPNSALQYVTVALKDKNATCFLSRTILQIASLTDNNGSLELNPSTLHFYTYTTAMTSTTITFDSSIHELVLIDAQYSGSINGVSFSNTTSLSSLTQCINLGSLSIRYNNGNYTLVYDGMMSGNIDYTGITIAAEINNQAISINPTSLQMMYYFSQDIGDYKSLSNTNVKVTMSKNGEVLLMKEFVIPDSGDVDAMISGGQLPGDINDIVDGNTTTPATTNLNLELGWNMVSLPVVATLSISDLNNTDIEIIRSFQNEEWYIWTKNSQVTTEKLLTELTNGNGYWIKVTNTTSISLAGTEVAGTTSIVTDAKWHMSGSASITDMDAFFINNPTVTTLWKYVNGEWLSISSKMDMQQTMYDANINQVNGITPNEGFMYK